MKKSQSIALFILATSILIAILSEYPHYEIGSELIAYHEKISILSSSSPPHNTIIPIISYNLRYDCSERDPNNDWVNRISRVHRVIQQYSPWVIGTQELLYPQAVELQQSLSPLGYQMVMFQGSKSQYTGTAIFYNVNRLELIESDLFWLSLTPRVEGSNSWGSSHPRMLTTARFKIRGSLNEDMQELIVLNTHLDHKGSEARKNQGRIVKETITALRKQFPNVPIVLTGDFNTAPGQGAYPVLVSNNRNNHTDHILLDSFKESKEEYSGVPSSFHFWFGAKVNVYLARIFLYLVFLADEVHNQKNFESVFPVHWSSLHMDWILYSPPEDKVEIIPRWTSVIDVTYENHSSDHFPVMTVFELTSKNSSAM